MHRLLWAVPLVAGASLCTSPAVAQTAATPPPPPAAHPAFDSAGNAIDSTGWSIAALLGVGFNHDIGFGLGARGGYTWDNHVYIGGTLLDHFGSRVNLVLLGGEGGYDFVAGPVILRAYGGLGFAVATVSTGGTEIVATPTGPVTEGSSVSTTITKVAFWPGGTVTYTFPQDPRFFVGGDARVYVISGFSTFATYGFGGIHF
jgi:hypothetical protein